MQPGLQTAHDFPRHSGEQLGSDLDDDRSNWVPLMRMNSNPRGDLDRQQTRSLDKP